MAEVLKSEPRHCAFCGGQQTCQDVKTKSILMNDSQGMKERYEVWMCTRPRGHNGPHIACAFDPVIPGEHRHQLQVWVNN